jgi:hypothetical protein
MATDFEKLAYETALRGLDSQERIVGELRTRTSTLMAASSVATSFLGQQAFRTPNSKAFVGAAVLALVVSMAASVLVLLPKKELVFAESGAAVYEGLYERRDDMPRVYQQLAYELDRFWSSNDLRITRLSRVYTLAAVASVVELILLAALTWGNLL